MPVEAPVQAAEQLGLQNQAHPTLGDIPVRRLEVKNISAMADAKDFSLDDANEINDSGPAKCSGGKCVNPCVQKCLPLPPKPCR